MQLLSSSDRAVRAVPQTHVQKEGDSLRPLFRPAKTAQQVMAEYPGVARKGLIRRARQQVTAEEEDRYAANLHNLPHQGELVRRFDSSSAAL